MVELESNPHPEGFEPTNLREAVKFAFDMLSDISINRCRFEPEVIEKKTRWAFSKLYYWYYTDMPQGKDETPVVSERVEQIKNRVNNTGPLWVHGQLANEWQMSGQSINRNMRQSHKQDVLDVLLATNEDIEYLFDVIEQRDAKIVELNRFFDGCDNNFKRVQEQLDQYKKALELAANYALCMHASFDNGRDMRLKDAGDPQYWLDKAK